MIFVWIAIMIALLVYGWAKKAGAKLDIIGDNLNFAVYQAKKKAAFDKMRPYLNNELELKANGRANQIEDHPSLEFAPEFTELFQYMRAHTSFQREDEFFAALKMAYLTRPTVLILQGLLSFERTANGFFTAVPNDPSWFSFSPEAAALRRENIKDYRKDIGERMNEFLWNYMIWYQDKLRELNIHVHIYSIDSLLLYDKRNYQKYIMGNEVGKTPEETVLPNKLDREDHPRISYWIWEARFIPYERNVYGDKTKALKDQIKQMSD